MRRELEIEIGLGLRQIQALQAWLRAMQQQLPIVRVASVNSPLQLVPKVSVPKPTTVALTDVASELTQAIWVNLGTAISVRKK